MHMSQLPLTGVLYDIILYQSCLSQSGSAIAKVVSTAALHVVTTLQTKEMLICTYTDQLLQLQSLGKPRLHHVPLYAS